MSPQRTSSLPPNKGTITHSQKRLDHLTKAAVERAYKLLTESRRLVQIVETHSCGNSKGLGCSNPFSSLSSVLLKNCSSTTPSSSKNWALSKDSNARRSVAARIHTFLNQWRADCSFDWRARVASVVPVLEEVLYKEAKSEEEYTNPQLLESQLMNVLCHFEAGNGPFLLQGSSPVYPVRACYPPSSSSDRMSPFCQHALGEGMPSNGDSVEIASEEIHERARLTCTQSSALGSSPILTEPVPNGWEANDTLQNICEAQLSTNKHGGHASSKIVKKVASILSKKRREKSECLKQELESADQGAETVEIINAEIDAVGSVETNNDGMGNERMRRTLGGMLKLNIFNIESSSEMNAEAAPLASSTSTSEDTFVFHTEEAPLSLSTTGEISHHRISNVKEEAPDLGCILDSQTSEVGTLEIVQADLGQGVSCLCESTSQSLVPSLSSTPPPPPLPPSSSSSSSSSWSSSSTSASLPCRSMSYSASSSLSPSSVSAPSPSRLILQHQAPLSIPSLSCSSSSSPPQQQFTHTSITCLLKSLPQHHSSSVSQKLAPFSTSSDVPSVELNYLKHKDHQSGTVNEHSTTQTTPQDCREIERGESSSTSSPSASSEEVSKRREKGVKLPLSSFLAEREEYMGSISSYEKGGPWDTWEETTEPLDGMCCVCMVGFKGAAFIPCGHTFCRKCSRELWRGRGTCPLCNRYIREILDIY